MLQESQSDEQRQNLYSQFFISGRDIAAFFTDCGSDYQKCNLVVANYESNPSISPTPDKVDNFYSLIDRCGMAVLVDQVNFLFYFFNNCLRFILKRIMYLFVFSIEDQSTSPELPINTHFCSSAKPWGSLFTI